MTAVRDEPVAVGGSDASSASRDTSEGAPRLWQLSVATCALAFAGHLIMGANTNVAAAIFAALWLFVGGVSIVAISRSGAPGPSSLLIVALVCFAGVLATSAVQLLPWGEAAAHPLWSALPDSVALTLDRDATLRELVKLASMAAALTAGYVVGVSDRRAGLFFMVMIAASGVYAGWAFLQQFAGIGDFLGVEKPYHVDRLTGSFLSANNAATTFGMLAVLAAARIARAVKESFPAGASQAPLEQLPRRGGVAALVLLLLLTCIMATQSRAGVAVAAAAIVVLAAWEVRTALKGARGATTAGVIALAAVAAAALLVSRETAARLELTLTDAGDRMTAFEVHAQAFLAAPWRGYGLGAFDALNDTLQTADTYRDLAHLHALHNVYLQWLVETGVIGSTLMFIAIGCVLAHIWSGLRARTRLLTWLRAAIVASFLVLAHGLVDYALQVPSIAWQWSLILGVAAGLAMPRPHEARRRSGSRSRP